MTRGQRAALAREVLNEVLIALDTSIDSDKANDIVKDLMSIIESYSDEE